MYLRTSFFAFDIFCDLCGQKTGELQLPTDLWGKQVGSDDLGIEDSRCDTCRDAYGSYSEIERVATTVLENPTPAAIKDYIVNRAGRTIQGAIQSLTPEEQPRIFAITFHDCDQTEATKRAVLRSVGIDPDNFDPDDKTDLLTALEEKAGRLESVEIQEIVERESDEKQG